MSDQDNEYARLVCYASGLGDDVPACGEVLISEQEYMKQMSRPNAGWHCPQCAGLVNFDDDYFETRNMQEPTQ